MAVYKAKQSTRRFVRIVLGLFLFGCATVRCDLCAAEQAETGVTADYIRLSIGIEDVEDIKNDIDQALKTSQT